jgi:hypothetical protein
MQAHSPGPCACAPARPARSDTISENLDGKQATYFEEMGVETDADAVKAGAPEYSALEQLLASKRRKLR